MKQPRLLLPDPRPPGPVRLPVAHPTGIDAYGPREIARRIEEAGVAKTELGLVELATLAVLAGAFIAFGAAFFTVVTTGVDASLGPHRLLGGVAFSLGLILVVVGGAELFTGNALIVMACVDGRVTSAALLRNWGIVLAGNLAGAVGLALAFWAAGSLEGAVGARAAAIATAKAELGPGEAFVRAVLCNALVCLAVWLSFAARDVTGKVLAVVGPISAFVALGLEHSIANMYLLPAGMLAGADIAASSVAANLLVVTLGNVLGGAGGVALSYRLAYGPRAPAGATGAAGTAGSTGSTAEAASELEKGPAP
jgi:formate/nitrite transporter